MTDDEFHAHVAREAAGAIGEWLAASHMERRAVWDLTQTDLQNMAIAAISRYIQLAAERHKDGQRFPEAIERALLGSALSA